VIGVGGGVTSAIGEIDVEITIPCNNAPDFIMTGKAHITPNLRPNMLVGTDLLNQYKCSLNFERQVVTFADGREASMSTSKRQERTTRVYASDTTILMPNVMIPIHVCYTDRSRSKTSQRIFIPQNDMFFTQAIDNGEVLYAVNRYNTPI